MEESGESTGEIGMVHPSLDQGRLLRPDEINEAEQATDGGGARAHAERDDLDSVPRHAFAFASLRCQGHDHCVHPGLPQGGEEPGKNLLRPASAQATNDMQHKMSIQWRRLPRQRDLAGAPREEAALESHFPQNGTVRSAPRHDDPPPPAYAAAADTRP